MPSARIYRWGQRPSALTSPPPFAFAQSGLGDGVRAYPLTASSIRGPLPNGSGMRSLAYTRKRILPQSGLGGKPLHHYSSRYKAT